MTLLEAIATMASELTYSKQWKQVSIEVNFDVEGKDKNLIKAKCYPINPSDPVAIFNLSFDQELVQKK